MTAKMVRLSPTGDPVKGLEPSNMTPAEAFTTNDKTERNHRFFATSDASITTGVWECAPSYEEIDSYPAHEMMTVIAGLVTVTQDGGKPETFCAGDTFFIAKGTKCTWRITETLKKFYMIAA